MITDEKLLGLVCSGYFRVDNDGSIWRQQVGTRTGNRRAISPVRADIVSNTGYRRVRFGKRGTFSAHRMVWVVLRGPIPDGLEINHKNGNKADNRISNLELLTHKANVHHAFRVLGVPPVAGEANGQSKLTAAQVVEIRAAINGGEPKRALARRFGVTPTLIRHIASGRAWKHAAFPEVT